MGDLASVVGVNRATLFRWVGSRDTLVAEVVWSVTEPTWWTAVGRTRGTGGGRIARVLGRFSAATIDSPFFGAWVRSEPERALRILTTNATPFAGRFQKLMEDLLSEEVDAGRLVPPLPLHDLAYIVRRICESFVYADMITGESPDAAKVEQAVKALLR